ncbi:MAG: amino acid carrier protein, partial [Clostridia bacterium]|nr:amino acid carrier protein [Clostridia bacterium]
AVFWMWISALLAMLLKFAEVVLAQRHRRYDARGRIHGGAPYYIKVAFGGTCGRVLAALFAALCVCCSLTLGAMIQTAAAAEALSTTFALPPIAVGMALGLLVALLLLLGARGVERACTAIVPFACVLFSVGSLVAIALHAKALPDALAAIFRGAWQGESAAGGVLGFFTSRAVRYGVARGLVSNEAGCGTAPFAHAMAESDLPARQGLFGVLEVFVDTVLLCTLSALVILTSGVPVERGGGMRYALAAYTATLGGAAAPLLTACVLLFAFATVLCWAHYGSESLRVLTQSRLAARLLVLAVALFCVLGALAAPTLVWELTDLILALMALINVTALLLLRREVIRESELLKASP